MKNQLFAVAVFDTKMEAYAAPFFTPTLGMAERSFADEVRRPESPMAAHPEDYHLYHVGYFDEDTGVLTGANPVQRLVSAINCLRKND